ncbi:hypothetical protein J4856_12445 [Prevotella scopos JCM 17725]|uniref:Uracil-DNA glycosylase-like domain-containing protein n=1 Tax=Prevotella scopos JCM 17725 TaxID=1236518 RepID=A0AAX2F6G6_9BACT|nr:hypothetical protein [Prevotella scopos]ANR72278.1 hypothetical protein AXF22_01875 [Prevotella scopos JCM 17725]QUB45515.1 hypothetical protein J4856_12445 [Prevotella scopos JCM 17725]SHG04462.1 hypothetical protein SAMN05444364_12936 [Prevotella scopos JCM 17725]
MTKEELLLWGEKTVQLYNKIADERGREKTPAFYTQSNLNKIIGVNSVDILIAGINPGSGGTYQQMIENPNWGISSATGMTAEQLISGNFGRAPQYGNCTNWSRHHTWHYFMNLKRFFKDVEEPNILDDERRFVLTNATFFNTVKEKELSQSLLKTTFPQTIDLVRRIKPKMIVWLSGRNAFYRLASISIDGFSFKYDKTRNPIMARIYMGTFNGIPCFGIPHPGAFLTTEERTLIAKFFSYVFNYKSIDEIDLNNLESFCINEIQAYHKRLKEKKPVSKKNNIDIKSIEHSILERKKTYIYNNGNRIRKDENAQYGITIAESYIFVRQAYEDKYKTPQINPNDDIVIEKLKEKGYKSRKGWLGSRKLMEFGSTEKEIEQKVIEEINLLFELLDV